MYIAGRFSDRIEALEDLDGTGVVAHLRDPDEPSIPPGGRCQVADYAAGTRLRARLHLRVQNAK